ncbi:hypothetical protein KY345_02505 [Candidatus Woesearchaeota archaeon]|nr:hypothetical protein [Candidatus Woesearchaeota archaeon]
MPETLVAEKQKPLETAVLSTFVSRRPTRYHSEAVLIDVVKNKKPVVYCWDNCGRVRIDGEWGRVPPDMHYLVNQYIINNGSTGIHPECEEIYRKKNSKLLE